MSLADVVIWLHNRRSDGVLLVDCGAASKEFSIEGGAVVRAASTDKREGLGQILVNFGLITEDQLQRAFEVQGETHVLLGRILVMIGIVKEDQVLRALELHIRETLLDAMRWTAGVFIFDVRPGRQERSEIEVTVPLIDVHREGARRVLLWDQCYQLFSDPKMVLAVDERQVPAGLDTTSFEGRILTYAKAGLTIEAVAMELHAHDFQVYSNLYDLHRRGVIKPCPPSGSSNPPPYFVEVDENADFESVAHQAYEEHDWAAALSHAEAGVKSSPENTELGRLGREAEARLAEQLERALPSMHAVPVLLTPVDDILLHRRLSARERYITTRIDGTRSIRSIMQVSPMRDIDALAIFRQLADEGFIRID